jgi:hypothetical protein
MSQHPSKGALNLGAQTTVSVKPGSLWRQFEENERRACELQRRLANHLPRRRAPSAFVAEIVILIILGVALLSCVVGVLIASDPTCNLAGIKSPLRATTLSSIAVHGAERQSCCNADHSECLVPSFGDEGLYT